jgi:hypothetical protein
MEEKARDRLGSCLTLRREEGDQVITWHKILKIVQSAAHSVDSTEILREIFDRTLSKALFHSRIELEALAFVDNVFMTGEHWRVFACLVYQARVSYHPIQGTVIGLETTEVVEWHTPSNSA